MKKIPGTLASTSPDKLREWRDILKFLFGEKAPSISGLQQGTQFLEDQSLSPSHVIEVKAVDAWKRLGRSVLVEDVSLSIDALNGYPGTLYGPIDKMIGLKGILHALEGHANRGAAVHVYIGFVHEDTMSVRLAHGTAIGTISKEVRGDQRFGFNQIFIPSGSQLTFAEMEAAQMYSVSPRTTAIRKLLTGPVESVSIASTSLGIYL